LIRAYAGKHARRRIVLCNAHVPSGGIVRNGQLLLDFHAFPLRIKRFPIAPRRQFCRSASPTAFMAAAREE
jgi:hypothetical protein